MDTRGLGKLGDYPADAAIIVTPPLGVPKDKDGKPIIARALAPIHNDCTAMTQQEIQQELLCNSRNVDRDIGLIRDLIEANFPGPEARSFLLTPTTPLVALAAKPSSGAVTTSVLTFTVPEGYDGYLKTIGVTSVPQGSMEDIQWQLLWQGMPIANFDANYFMSNSVNVPQPFHFRLKQSGILQLNATNNSGNANNVTAIISGWLNQVKRF